MDRRGRVRLGVTALLAVLASLTACGGDKGIPLDPDVVMRAPPTGSGGEPVALDSWEPSAVASDVVAVFLTGPCDRLVSTRAEETAEDVKLWVTLQLTTDECTSNLVSFRVALSLAEPIGDRKVLDGSTGELLHRSR